VEGTCGEQDKCIHGFGGETWRKQTTLKACAWFRG